jgi:hypothetical protein
MASAYVPALIIRVSALAKHFKPAAIVSFGFKVDCACAQLLESLPVLAT